MKKLPAQLRDDLWAQSLFPDNGAITKTPGQVNQGKGMRELALHIIDYTENSVQAGADRIQIAWTPPGMINTLGSPSQTTEREFISFDTRRKGSRTGSTNVHDAAWEQDAVDRTHNHINTLR
ncbi:MAG: hypothetical protein V1793_06130 [Pseudomonadota bacterium]